MMILGVSAMTTFHIYWFGILIRDPTLTVGNVVITDASTGEFKYTPQPDAYGADSFFAVVADPAG